MVGTNNSQSVNQKFLTCLGHRDAANGETVKSEWEPVVAKEHEYPRSGLQDDLKKQPMACWKKQKNMDIHTHTHIHTHIHTYTYTHTHIHTHIDTGIYWYIYIYITYMYNYI